MQEEVKTSEIIHPKASNPKENSWLCFENEFEEIPSTFKVKKSFYEEMKAYHKKIRINKKVPTKATMPLQKSTDPFDSPIQSPSNEDCVYQTAIPNTV